VFLFFKLLFETYWCSKKLGGSLLYFHGIINFGDKKGWATFWAIFSQTHLVTLLSPHTMRARQHLSKKSRVSRSFPSSNLSQFFVGAIKKTFQWLIIRSKNLKKI
jgi:hypothetical protein